jgi:large subunit ribosomal protein L3
MAFLLGKKVGMTQVFATDGKLVAATVIVAGPCPVLAVKQKTIALGFEPVAQERLKRPLWGVFDKLKISPRKVIKEFAKSAGQEYKVGEELKVDLFKPGEYLDISGLSKGKGFQGGVKRWHWHGGPQTHGSTSHRRAGSIGSTTTPGRVWKGHHLPGHMGRRRVTLQNLKIIKVDLQNNLLVVNGAVPGGKNSYLVIKKAKKKQIAASSRAH